MVSTRQTPSQHKMPPCCHMLLQHPDLSIFEPQHQTMFRHTCIPLYAVSTDNYDAPITISEEYSEVNEEADHYNQLYTLDAFYYDSAMHTPMPEHAL